MSIAQYLLITNFFNLIKPEQNECVILGVGAIFPIVSIFPPLKDALATILLYIVFSVLFFN